MQHLIDKWRERAGKGYRLYVDGIGSPVKQCADELEQALSEQWVSVEDGLPDDYQDVLINTAYSKQAVAYRMQDSATWLDSMRPNQTYGSVTHWQPLPAPPKGDNNE